MQAAVHASKPWLFSVGIVAVLLEIFAGTPAGDSRSIPVSAASPTIVGAVRSAVENGAATADEIVLRLGLPASRVSELILTLRLEGVLVTDPAGRLQIPKHLI